MFVLAISTARLQLWLGSAVEIQDQPFQVTPFPLLGPPG